MDAPDDGGRGSSSKQSMLEAFSTLSSLANIITQGRDPGEAEPSQQGVDEPYEPGPDLKRQRIDPHPHHRPGSDDGGAGGASGHHALALVLQHVQQQEQVLQEQYATAAAAAAAQEQQRQHPHHAGGPQGDPGLAAQGQGESGAHHELPNVLLAQQQLMAQHMQAEQAAQLAALQQQQQQYVGGGSGHHPVHHPHAHLHYALGQGMAGDTAAAVSATAHPGAAAAAQEALEAAQQAHDLAAAHETQMVAIQQVPIITDIPQLAFDPAAIAAATAAGTAVTIPLSMLEGLTPEHLQMLGAGNGFSLVAAPTGSFGVQQAQGSGAQGQQVADPAMQYKNWWDEEHEKELLELVNNREYSKAVLGTEELDWAALEVHFNRSQNALRKKYWMLSKAQQAVAVPQGTASSGASTGAGRQKQRAERKNWSESETAELMRLTQDPVYLREKLGLEDMDWEQVASHLKTTVATAKRKYRHVLEQQQLAAQQAQAALPQLAVLQQQGFAAAALPPGTLLEKGKRQHHRKNVPYRWMIVSAMSMMEGLEGTALEIFQKIEAAPNFQEQLDTRIMPGTKHVPRWKIQVRKVLSADNIFLNTGRKHKHETIWRLNSSALQEGSQAERQRQRAGISPIPIPSMAGGGDAELGDAQADSAAEQVLQQQQHEQGQQAALGHAAAGDGGAGQDVAGHGGGLGLLHEQLQQMHAAAASAAAGGGDLSVEHLLGPGADAAAVAAGALHHHQDSHHQQHQHLPGVHGGPEGDDPQQLGISTEHLLHEAQQLGFSTEQLHAAQVMLPEHLLHQLAQQAQQGGVAEVLGGAHGMPHLQHEQHLLEQHPQHAQQVEQLMAAQHAQQMAAAMQHHAAAVAAAEAAQGMHLSQE